MKELEGKERALADQLFRIQAVKFGEYRIKYHKEHPEAPPSPVYIDLRAVRSFPYIKNLAVGVYENLLEGLDFDFLSDVPTAATIFVSSLMDRLEKGMISPRLEDKNYGIDSKIDGFVPESDIPLKSVVIDDLVSDAGSKLDAVNILRDEGLLVKDVVVLIDREQGGRDTLAQHGLELHNALTLAPMLEYYLKSGLITNETYGNVNRGMEELREYQKQNP